MYDILEIEFKGRRQEYASNPMEFPFELGEPAIVQVERGFDLGRVSHIGWRPGMESEQLPTLTVVRKAQAADLRIAEQNALHERDAARIARQKILDHHLEMKLVDVEMQWDGRKLTFYFVADGRVDFRELVKDLAATFRTRIDLRQIGARDETKRTGGYGVCGLPLCCSTFLTEFKPITTQMPRDQFLPLNPSKLSGVCGRLKCCMRYELDMYRDFQRRCPRVGQPVQNDVKGQGSIEKLDIIREQIHVRYASGELERYSPGEFAELSNWTPEMAKSECICLRTRQSVVTPPPEFSSAPESTASEPEGTGGQRVTLLPTGGLGLGRTESGQEIHVGTNFDTALTGAKAKKKRKRRRKKKSATTTSPPISTPTDAAQSSSA